MKFKFTLQNDILGTQEISEPDGWKECILKLERDPNFHSLIEYFDGKFIFYGSNGVFDGGINFIRACEQIGINEILSITIEFSFDLINYETLFTGQLDLSTIQQISDNKIQIDIIRSDFWAKFISRLDTPVDIQSSTNLDGESSDIIPYIDLTLPSQKIDYNADYELVDSLTLNVTSILNYLQFDYDNIVLNDFGTLKFSLPNSEISPSEIVGIIEAPWDGEFTISAKSTTAVYQTGPDRWLQDAGIFARRTIGSTWERSGTTVIETVGINSYNHTTINETLYMHKGDQIAIVSSGGGITGDVTIFGSRRLRWIGADYATTENIVLFGEQVIDGTLTSSTTVLVKDQAAAEENGKYRSNAGAWTRTSDCDSASELNNLGVHIVFGVVNIDLSFRQANDIKVIGVDEVSFIDCPDNRERTVPYDGSPAETYLRITQSSTFKDSSCQSLLTHDVGRSIIDRTTGINNKFYSEFLGGEFTSPVYITNGCGYPFANMKGLQIRGYTLTEKPFYISFNDWWNGINPILNLGLCYDTVSGNEVIRVEEKEFFYDDSQVSVYFSNVQDIKRAYDKTWLLNKVEIGYEKWQSEDISGIDDTQTKHTYSTILKRAGQAITLFSKFIAASLAIETTRRTTKTQSADYKFDNETFIIALNPTQIDISPETSPDVTDFKPELDENFTSISGLLNSETRYNNNITPARNFKRWAKFLQGCLQSYLTSVFKFVSGEGNYTANSAHKSDSCNDADSVTENDNIQVTSDYVFLPILYEISLPMEIEDYNSIRDKRTNPIAVSRTTENYAKFFIKTLEYKLAQGIATITAWPITFMDISVVESKFTMEGCPPASATITEDSFRLLEDGEFILLEDGSFRLLE